MIHTTIITLTDKDRNGSTRTVAFTTMSEHPYARIAEAARRGSIDDIGDPNLRRNAHQLLAAEDQLRRLCAAAPTDGPPPGLYWMRIAGGVPDDGDEGSWTVVRRRRYGLGSSDGKTVQIGDETPLEHHGDVTLGPPALPPDDAVMRGLCAFADLADAAGAIGSADTLAALDWLRQARAL